MRNKYIKSKQTKKIMKKCTENVKRQKKYKYNIKKQETKKITNNRKPYFLLYELYLVRKKWNIAFVV